MRMRAKIFNPVCHHQSNNISCLICTYLCTYVSYCGYYHFLFNLQSFLRRSTINEPIEDRSFTFFYERTLSLMAYCIFTNPSFNLLWFLAHLYIGSIYKVYSG